MKIKQKAVYAKDLLTLHELTSEQMYELFHMAMDMKQYGTKNVLQGKILGMIFDKASTRTRVSFEAGMIQLGGSALYLNGSDLQLGRGEPIEDTAKVLSSYVDAIMIRTFSHEKVELLAKYASIPVINGLTDDHHPCQALADMMTIYEIMDTFNGVKLTYIGDGNNVCHSLLLAAAKVGLHVVCATPLGHEPSEQIVEEAKGIAVQTGAVIEITNDPIEAVHGAHFIYSDVWASMGQEKEQEARKEVFQGYQVNDALVAHAHPNYYFMHCLPAHREEEVTTSIIDGEHSIVFMQAENRLHIQKALLKALLTEQE
ncbi:ornithine carbamoyltransferase [Priestia taiwanensis]|uniref:Ornithine carbamoyltransferase n=1 Tax=Priestia taiwanensis TaxID=1347902 RepID=A0A917AWR5_9BACI|nr:ornithine carbamoyltransferase [Priestia taiwanensis]MBM7363515.1 ornithine carbamoyltransferase [Priestia taiwanensis]GGE76493.1 ornithine carbamoyltransferase [Priestia taiwanensis]